MRNQERPAGLLTKIAGAVINFFAASDARSQGRNELDKPSPVAFDTPIFPTARIEAERRAAEARAVEAQLEPVAASQAEVTIIDERAPYAQPELAPAVAEETVDETTENAAPAAPLLQAADLAATSDAAETEAPAVDEPAPAVEESEGEPEPVGEEASVDTEAEEPAVAQEAAAEDAVVADEPVLEVQDADSEVAPETKVAEVASQIAADADPLEVQDAEFDLPLLVASLATDKRGRAKTPKDFYGVMRFRFGMNRDTVKDTLELCEAGLAKRGEGKKVLCAWVETLLRNVPGEELTLSEIRATLPDFVYQTYGPHAAQGLVGAVSACEFIAVIRDGQLVEGRAKAGDTIRIA